MRVIRERTKEYYPFIKKHHRYCDGTFQILIIALLPKANASRCPRMMKVE